MEDAIITALEVEKIDKENERMVRKVEEPIPTFIPVHHHQTTNPVIYHNNSPKYETNPIPLASRDPVLRLPSTQDDLEQLRLEMRTLTSEMTKSICELTEQMACLVRGQDKQTPPVYHESGTYTTGIWCNNCGKPNH